MGQKIEYAKLTAGYKFPPSSFKLDGETVKGYLSAVEDTSQAYRETGLVPPMAVAALAMAAMTQGIVLPPGAIHVSQELEFMDEAAVGETLTSDATVTRKQERGKFHILAIGIKVSNRAGETVVAGETSFILPLA